ncbi:hypothetical protein GCM10008985_16500 [Halococcus dombrowskii]|uniref:Uncharacterized protein n=1 Tax=Halococcus dombrowskii TaxID=179637 RepID=A0AAV3SG71_HALDO
MDAAGLGADRDAAASSPRLADYLRGPVDGAAGPSGMLLCGFCDEPAERGLATISTVRTTDERATVRSQLRALLAEATDRIRGRITLCCE